MENKKGFIHIEVEGEEGAWITKYNIEKMDNKMMLAALYTILQYLMEIDTNLATYIWANVAINNIGYDEAIKFLKSMNDAIIEKNKGATEDEKKN